MADEKMCDLCGGTGVYNMPIAYDDGNGTVRGETVRITCHGCNGTGKAKDRPQIQGEPMKHAPTMMADSNSTQRQMPKRIYITSEGTPSRTSIHDAETGEMIPGVMEVHITRRGVEAVVTPHWPLTPADYTVNNPPDHEGETHQGVNVERHRYPLKRLEAESW